jgi:hypothetical protein
MGAHCVLLVRGDPGVCVVSVVCGVCHSAASQGFCQGDPCLAAAGVGPGVPAQAGW